MFGETSSESPRMPSPWEALATPASSHQPSPLASSANLAVPSTPLRNVLDASGTPPSSVESMKYLDEAIRVSGGDVLSGPAGEGFPKLVPEIEEGNVEYKLKLIAPTPARFTRLVTQLKYRLLEGGGQALYEIGVSDSGELVGLSRKDLEASLDTLDKMAGELGATVVVLKEIELPPGGVHMQAQRGGKRIVVADGKVEVLEVGLEGGDPSNGVLLTVENGSGGARNRVVLRTGRKKKDKDARRKRRAAALLVGEIATTDLGLKLDGDVVPSSASSNPSGDASSPFADDDDSGLDLTATVTLKKPDEQPADVRRTSPIPMPIIKTYPYGRQPFAMARGRLSTSLSSNPEATSPAARESSAAESSPTPDYTVEDFVYIPSSSASDSRSPKPTWAASGVAGKEGLLKKSSSDEDDNDNDDDDDGDAFGFGLDLEIDSFTKSMDSFTAKGLAPSPHVKPSSSSRNHRPLHYTSTTASGSSSTIALDQPTSDSSAAAVAAAHLKRLKVPNQKKKAIVLPPAPSTNSAADKAAQRRSKRDARRDERRRKVNGLPLADEAEVDSSNVPGEQVAPDGAASSTNGLVDQMVNVHLEPPSTPQISQQSPSAEERSLVDDNEPKIIAEALVVRKLALEEAFLDYRGFALIDPTAELSTADGGDEDGDGDGENQSPSED